MSDVELLIKIPEDVYNRFKNLNQVIGILAFEKETRTLIKAVKKGIPLPKGHGRIVDISKIEYMKTLNEAIHNRLPWKEAIRRIKNSAPIIIERSNDGSD